VRTVAALADARHVEAVTSVSSSSQPACTVVASSALSSDDDCRLVRTSSSCPFVNDELSALLATTVQADWLLLLTDVDGFYMRASARSRDCCARCGN